MVSIKGQDENDLASKYGVRFEWFFMSPDGSMFAELLALIDDGHVKPVIDSVYPLAKFSDAYDHLDTGRTVGKIVVAIK